MGGCLLEDSDKTRDGDYVGLSDSLHPLTRVGQEPGSGLIPVSTLEEPRSKRDALPRGSKKRHKPKDRNVRDVL